MFLEFDYWLLIGNNEITGAYNCQIYKRLRNTFGSRSHRRRSNKPFRGLLLLLFLFLRCSTLGDLSGVTHLSIGVIIYPGGSVVRHPKGARSIGIGHPRSTETRRYPLDPLRVAEQKSSFPVTRKGSRSNAYAYCTPMHDVAKTAEDALLFRK